MIRVVMFDLGMTLVDANARPFAHVREALDAIGRFETADGKPLRMCLVSDFTMPAPPATPAKVRALFAEYLELLDRTGLRDAFEPVARRVTLSTHAGAIKPARVVFDTALKRLRVRATLDECLFVTENAAHIAAARDQLGMGVLRFGATGEEAFDDWSQAPALIAQRIAPGHDANAHAAIRAHLAARDVDVASIAPADAAGTRAVSARVWRTLPAEAGAAPLRIAVPVSATVSRAPSGALHARVDEPTAEAIEETANYARSLAAHAQIAAPGAPATGEATHVIEVDAQGRRTLVRQRFKAI